MLGKDGLGLEEKNDPLQLWCCCCLPVCSCPCKREAGGPLATPAACGQTWHGCNRTRV